IGEKQPDGRTRSGKPVCRCRSRCAHCAPGNADRVCLWFGRCLRGLRSHGGYERVARRRSAHACDLKKGQGPVDNSRDSGCVRDEVSVACTAAEGWVSNGCSEHRCSDRVGSAGSNLRPGYLRRERAIPGWFRSLAERTDRTTLRLTSGISLLISGNGGSVMPSKLTLSWPVDSRTPLAGPFILGGIIMFVAGLVLLLVGFLHFRRSRGPRRGRPRGLRGLLHVPPRPAKDVTSTGEARSGRRRRVAVSVSALLLLSGCSPDYWPSPASTEPAIETPDATAPVADPAASAAPKPGDLQVEPAVTVPQMERIMQRVSEFAATVDSSRDAKAAEQRFTGPALANRVANSTIRGTLTSQPAPPPIPASPLTLTLPQQVTDWPRAVLTIAKDSAAPTVAPMALVLVQDSPRTNYRIEYTMSLAPDAQVPEVGPASIGAAPISPEFKGLVLP